MNAIAWVALIVTALELGGLWLLWRSHNKREQERRG